MEEYLNKGIKEIISKFPEVGRILDEYNIGCTPCSVGTCLLKDIVEIHNLSPRDEQELMVRIAKVIYPDRDAKIPEIRKRPRATSREIRYSPPMKRLVDEHVLIKRWIALIPKIIENLDTSTAPNLALKSEVKKRRSVSTLSANPGLQAGDSQRVDLESVEWRKIILDGVDFMHSYADRYHHAKEEEILFKYFDENLDILKVIHEDHENARAHARAILEALDKKDKHAVAAHLSAYSELLTEHIKKEDEILYPWMDRGLSTRQVGELFSKFIEADEKSGKEVVDKCRRFVQEVEEK